MISSEVSTASEEQTKPLVGGDHCGLVAYNEEDENSNEEEGYDVYGRSQQQKFGGEQQHTKTTTVAAESAAAAESVAAVIVEVAAVATAAVAETTSVSSTSWFRAARPGHLFAPYSSNDASQFEIISFTLIFYASMIAYDFAIEAASIQFITLDALPYAITLFQFGFCLLLPSAISYGRGKTFLQDFPKTCDDIQPYIGLSIIVFVGTSLEHFSIRHVSYYTKSMLKSSKLIPTMIFSSCLLQHQPQQQLTQLSTSTKVTTSDLNNHNAIHYSWVEYLAASLLCLGAAGFCLNGNNDDTENNDIKSSSTGILILMFSVLCDGVVPNIQQNLMTSPSPSVPSSPSSQLFSKQPVIMVGQNINKSNEKSVGLSAVSLMINMNTVGFCGCLLYMFFSGHLVSAIEAAFDEPRLFMYLSLAGIGLSTALLAYTRLIKSSGSVIAVAVATLRKVVSVIISYIVFPNKKLSTMHIISGVLVSVSIIINTHYGGITTTTSTTTTTTTTNNNNKNNNLSSPTSNLTSTVNGSISTNDLQHQQKFKCKVNDDGGKVENVELVARTKSKDRKYIRSASLGTTSLKL